MRDGARSPVPVVGDVSSSPGGGGGGGGFLEAAALLRRQHGRRPAARRARGGRPPRNQGPPVLPPPPERRPRHPQGATHQRQTPTRSHYITSPTKGISMAPDALSLGPDAAACADAVRVAVPERGVVRPARQARARGPVAPGDGQHRGRVPADCRLSL